VSQYNCTITISPINTVADKTSHFNIEDFMDKKNGKRKIEIVCVL